MKDILTGGNHLANVLIGRLGPGFATMYPPTTDGSVVFDEVGGGDTYDVWCCWAAIMRSRDDARVERSPVLPCLQPDATDSACKCCQRRFYRDEQSNERMQGTPFNIGHHKALLHYADPKNWNPVADYSEGYWYMAGRPWMQALAALKDSGIDVDLTLPRSLEDPLEVSDADRLQGAIDHLESQVERLALQTESDLATITALKDDLAKVRVISEAAMAWFGADAEFRRLNTQLDGQDGMTFEQDGNFGRAIEARDNAMDALKAACEGSAPVVQEHGWKLVPITPTPEMLDAFLKGWSRMVWDHKGPLPVRLTLGNGYADMLEATPAHVETPKMEIPPGLVTRTRAFLNRLTKPGAAQMPAGFYNDIAAIESLLAKAEHHD